MKLISIAAATVLFYTIGVDAFLAAPHAKLLNPTLTALSGGASPEESKMPTTRRLFVTTTAAFFSAASVSTPALASGGATAGGAYLLRAKARYSDRVKKGAAAYLALDPSLGGKNPFFQGDKDSQAEDFLAAGMLLANAFRTNSTTAPDSLPTVKKYKVFLKEYEAFLKLSKKKGGADAAAECYARSTELLKVYLSSVQL